MVISIRIWATLILVATMCGTLAMAEDDPTVELETVVVTAPTETAPSATRPAVVLNDDELTVKMGHSIGDTLKQEPGMTSQSFGPGVGTPVIRGQAGPRVRVLSNGIGSNDASSISPDHAASVEPFFAERIEVLRGPTTLPYGASALGGVVNIIDNRVPRSAPAHSIDGGLEQRYDTTSNQTSTAIKIDGGEGIAAFHLDGFYREHDNLAIGGSAIDETAARQVDPSLPVRLNNLKGTLPNSWGHSAGGSAGVSWIGDFGYAGLSINRLENNYGIPLDGTGNEQGRIDLRQNKYDFKSELKAPLNWLKALRTQIGYTDYQHTEIANGAVGAYYNNQTHEARLELEHQQFGLFRGTVGFQAVSSDFRAFEKSTGLTIVPHSQIQNFATYALEGIEAGPLSYQFGLRIENAGIHPEHQTAFSFNPVSASAAANWAIDERHELNLSLTRSQRAPQVQELLANGYHDATRSYDVGNSRLQEETAYGLDLGYHFKGKSVMGDFDVFHNWAKDYIYMQRSGRFLTEDGELCLRPSPCVPELRTRQTDAIFRGFEGKLTFSLMENKFGLIDVNMFSDYTRGQFDNGTYVPRLPPLRYGIGIEYIKDKVMADLRITRGEPQDRPGAAESRTPGYVLLNLSAQYRMTNIGKSDVLLFVKATNLLDQNIRNSTSYLRSYAPEPGRGAEIGIRIAY